MSARIVVTSPSFSKDPELVSRLKNSFPEALLNANSIRLEGDALQKYLKDATAAIIGTERIDGAVLQACPHLKKISKYGVGLDNIDFEACKKLGVEVRWTAGVNKRSVSELVIAKTLGLLRNMWVTAVQLKAGKWNKNGGTQLTGKTVGIIGLGNIGQDLVHLLKPFDCQILANDIVDRTFFAAQNGVKLVSKEQIYREADVITVHVPLTSETKDLIGTAELKMMKPTAILINTARGGIINEKALKQALRENLIAGAALDAYVEEPLIDPEMGTFPNLITTPHIGGNAREAVLAMGHAAIDNLLQMISE